MSLRERLDNVIGDLNDPDGVVHSWVNNGGAKSKMKGDDLKEIVSRLAEELEGVRDDMPDENQVSNQEYAGTDRPNAAAENVLDVNADTANPMQHLGEPSERPGIEDPEIPTPPGPYVLATDPHTGVAQADPQPPSVVGPHTDEVHDSDVVTPANDPQSNPQAYGPDESNTSTDADSEDDADADNVNDAEESDDPDSVK